jgi:hypothetical protein
VTGPSATAAATAAATASTTAAASTAATTAATAAATVAAAATASCQQLQQLEVRSCITFCMSSNVHCPWHWFYSITLHLALFSLSLST